MNKIYYLSTCSTCQKILSQIDTSLFTLQDIKTDTITQSQIEEMRLLTDSYESLFSRRAMKYKTLVTKPSTEDDYKQLILDEYTFLKRPVIIIDKQIFIGSSKVELKKLLLNI